MTAIWIAIAALAVAGFALWRTFNMPTIKESLQSDIAFAVEAINGLNQAATDAVLKLQELKGTIPDDTWLSITQPLVDASKSAVAAKDALEDEMTATTGATGS